MYRGDVPIPARFPAVDRRVHRPPSTSPFERDSRRDFPHNLLKVTTFGLCCLICSGVRETARSRDNVPRSAVVCHFEQV